MYRLDNFFFFDAMDRVLDVGDLKTLVDILCGELIDGKEVANRLITLFEMEVKADMEGILAVI
jgi:hypothetical protein